MTFPLKELAHLLTRDNAQIGVVVESNNASVKVATPQGAMSVSALEKLKVGDRVLVSNGTATRAPNASTSYPV